MTVDRYAVELVENNINRSLVCKVIIIFFEDNQCSATKGGRGVVDILIY